MNIPGRQNLATAPDQAYWNHRASDQGPLAVGAAPPNPEFYRAKRRRLSTTTQLQGATENERHGAALELHDLEHRELHQQMKAMGAPDWAIGLGQAINDLQNNMNHRFNQVNNHFNQVNNRFNQVNNRFNHINHRVNQIDNAVADLISDLGGITNDLAIAINGSATHPHHRLRRVRNAHGDFPEWFPGTRGELLNLSNAEATALIQFYEQVPVDIAGVPIVNRRIKAIAAYIGVRDV